MQVQASTHAIGVVDELHVHDMIARHVCDNLDWGKGTIKPQSSFLETEAQRDLLAAVMESLEPIQETTYSACTDGRLPVRLLDGETFVPVREQLAGADIVCAFYVAEILGASFYRDAGAPVAERVAQVAEFLHENNLNPSSHVGCGAATNYAAIAANVIGLSDDQAYIARLQTLMPEGLYDEALHKHVNAIIQQQLDTDAYRDLTAQTFIDAVETVSGKHAIEELQDDGRGVHGHVEEQIIRIRVPGYGLNERKLAALSQGREVFAINDARIERLARLFSRGNDKDYRLAYLALEDFTDAAHATLAQGLPTYAIEAA